MKRSLFAAVIVGVLLPLSALAVEAHHQPTAPAPGETQLTDGEIRKVDKDAKKITVRHGPIANLGMPAMTMVFQVKDPAMLDQVKAGDRIKFAADKAGSAYTITQIEVTK